MNEHHDSAPYRLQRLALSSNEDAAPRCKILHGDRVVVPATDGCDLVAQPALGEGHVLFITYDSPFDEGLHLLYLDADDSLVDEARLGFLYPSGIGLVQGVQRTDGQQLEFDFYGRWRLTVDRPAPTGARQARGVTRPWRWWFRPRRMHFESLPPTKQP